MELKSWQFICPDCSRVTEKGGTGHRKRCSTCASARHKAQQKSWQRENNFYDYKRGPHKPKGGA